MTATEENRKQVSFIQNKQGPSIEISIGSLNSPLKVMKASKMVLPIPNVLTVSKSWKCCNKTSSTTKLSRQIFDAKKVKLFVDLNQVTSKAIGQSLKHLKQHQRGSEDVIENLSEIKIRSIWL